MDLSRAIAAADNGMWSSVIDCLQDFPLDRLKDNDRVLDLALQVLLHGDLEQQWTIAKIIPKLGEIALQPLIELVNNPDIDLEDRWAAGRILGGFNQPQSIAALVTLIQQDEDPELTAIATGALAQIGTPAIAALTALLVPTAAGGSSQLALAVGTLARIRHSQTIEPLLQLVDNPDPQIRTLVIEALGSFHDPRVLPLLISKLTDVSASVRKATVVALCLRGDLATELNLLDRLQPLLFDLNLEVCLAAARGLARVNDPGVVPLLAKVLGSSQTPDRLKSAVILALGWIGTQPAIDVLIAALTQTDPFAPELMIAIGKTERERTYASQQLVAYWRSSHLAATPLPSIVKQEIATALGNLGNLATVPDLEQLLTDPDDRVRLHAHTAIAKLSSTI
ncbi:HEAT repeat domain-containing protein [Chamaesiphon sp. OTE_75_metabat_556]|uniref:HEAT repeat domain-containing protein n=1 Tax=Chamaesiphon sp. OTE_75_metabat_556 TaxID=2964692 RepID=UPI00286A6F06|nr:HEAT repeat domain-containing protein [Chamaesiphon sp. OTE_75_metabat_556]